MQVLYKSTRGKEETVTASMAILKGLSEDGGLFVPTEIPKLDVPPYLSRSEERRVGKSVQR